MELKDDIEKFLANYYDRKFIASPKRELGVHTKYVEQLLSIIQRENERVRQFSLREGFEAARKTSMQVPFCMTYNAPKPQVFKEVFTYPTIEDYLNSLKPYNPSK